MNGSFLCLGAIGILLGGCEQSAPWYAGAQYRQPYQQTFRGRWVRPLNEDRLAMEEREVLQEVNSRRSSVTEPEIAESQRPAPNEPPAKTVSPLPYEPTCSK